MITQTEKTVVDLVELAYGDSNGHKVRLLDFKTEGIKDLDIIQACLNKIGHYNDFDPIEVFKIIAHNNDFYSYVEIGREGSPCLYVNLPYWTHQKALLVEGEESRRYTAQEIEYMKDCIEISAKAAQADEITFNHNTIRLWWD
jgi:hypothetical protein